MAVIRANALGQGPSQRKRISADLRFAEHTSRRRPVAIRNSVTGVSEMASVTWGPVEGEMYPNGAGFLDRDENLAAPETVVVELVLQ